MGIIKNLRDSLAVRNAVQQKDGFNGVYGPGYQGSAQLNYYNGLESDIYTRDYTSHFFNGLGRGGEYDNYYGDYNRIIQVAPTFPFYYVVKDKIVDKGDFAKYLAEPNLDYPQFKVLQQMYSEMVTNGYTDVFLWRKDGKKDTNLFDDKKYSEDDFRGITIVSGYRWDGLTKAEKANIVRITYGASQSNVFMGYSPSQAANSWRGMQDEMGLHMTAFARNAGMPIGKFIITAPNIEDYKKLRDNLDNKISGAKNNGKILYDWRPTESQVSKIEWVQFTSQDVQDYTAQLEFAEKKMSQSFGVPGTVKGTNDGENYATARVSEHIFIKYTIKSLIEDLRLQLEHAIKQRFELKGEIRCNVPLPEIADESKVKIEATTLQVALFDQKLAEGYTPESIVSAYDLPTSFLLLEKVNNTTETSNTPKNSQKKAKKEHDHAENEFTRQYQNLLTKKEVAEIEGKYEKVVKDYVKKVLKSEANSAKNAVSKTDKDEFKGNMTAVFNDEYVKLYSKTKEDVAEHLLKELDSVDVSELDLTDDELEAARALYEKRVADFVTTFTENIQKLDGETLEVKERNAEPHIKRVVVSESEHTRIVSELKAWTKAQEEFPVRVYKTWNARNGACDECVALHNMKIDVTALFVGRADGERIEEIYEVSGGGRHASCRCYVQYEMERQK